MVDVRNDYRRFQEAGGKVAVVTMGPPERVAAFVKHFELPFPCLSDTRRNAYRAYELRSGNWLEIFSPAVWLKGLRALFRVGIGIPRGDLKQMPGTFIIDTSGIVRYIHRPRHSADNPSNDELLKVLQSLR